MSALWRPADKIIKVVETFAEARSLLDSFAGRDFGAICLKGVAQGTPADFWTSDAELRQFAYDATRITRSPQMPGFTLISRLRSPQNTAEHRRVRVFDGNIAQHIEGVTARTSEGSVTYLHPLFAPTAYRGSLHHITGLGSTTWVMNRLSDFAARQLVAGHPVVNGGTADSNPLDRPMQGEFVRLEAGDYITPHAFAVYGEPIYMHGTADSSPDRQSIGYLPRSVVAPSIIAA